MNDPVEPPQSLCHLSAEIRLELLIGQLWDTTVTARKLVAALRLQRTASATTRSQLEYLVELAGATWQDVGRLREEVQRLTRQGLQ